MIRIAVLAICTSLAGCACDTRIQRVEVPVPVPCVSPDTVPAAPASRFDAVQRGAALDEKVRALLVDRENGATYTGKLRALLRACEGDPGNVR